MKVSKSSNLEVTGNPSVHGLIEELCIDTR